MIKGSKNRKTYIVVRCSILYIDYSSITLFSAFPVIILLEIATRLVESIPIGLKRDQHSDHTLQKSSGQTYRYNKSCIYQNKWQVSNKVERKTREGLHCSRCRTPE